jgi:N-acetylglucosaminyl-diphospho-decaprenol L-rhamnosyltransferase
MPPPIESLTVVVVHYETPHLSERCVRSLVEHGIPEERIVVVDNGSGEGRPDGIRPEFPGCRILRLESNVGYARASNAGAEALPGAAYLVTNNDAFAHAPGSVARLLGALDDPDVGVVAPKLLNTDLTLQRTVRPADRPLVALVRASGLSRLVPNRFRAQLTTHWDHSESRPVEIVDGAVLLVRDETWRELGGYNGDIAMFAEDSDLCWRAGNAGWTVWFEQAAEFVHLGNATGSKIWSRPERGRIIGRSEALLLREQLSPGRARITIAIISLGLALRWLAFTLLRQHLRAGYTRAQLAGYLSGLAGTRTPAASAE